MDLRTGVHTFSSVGHGSIRLGNGRPGKVSLWCQKPVCCNHWPCPCSSTPSSCWDQVGMDMWGRLLSIVPMGSREGEDLALLSWPTQSWQGWEEAARLLLAAGLRHPAMRVCRLCSSCSRQPSGNNSVLRWKRSGSKWGRGQYENGYNGIKIVAPASPPAGVRL